MSRRTMLSWLIASASVLVASTLVALLARVPTWGWHILCGEAGYSLWTPHNVTPTPRSQAVMEADEDEAGSCRTPGHAVLVRDACREGDANGIACLIDDEIRDIRRGEAPVARSSEGRVRGTHRRSRGRAPLFLLPLGDVCRP